jgi:DNA-binding NtrC family response regulator
LYVVLAGARLRASGDRIDAPDLPAFVRQAVNLEHMQGGTTARPLPLDQLLEQAERRLIQLALRMSGGKHTLAAKLLNIPRPRLWRRMNLLGLAEAKDLGRMKDEG